MGQARACGDAITASVRYRSATVAFCKLEQPRGGGVMIGVLAQALA